jgi:hypothetical protein
MKKRKQTGTGYKYISSPSIKGLPREIVIAAMREAKFADDRYKFQSLFVREIVWLHNEAVSQLESEMDGELSNADRVILSQRKARLSAQVQSLAGFLARLLWKGLSRDDISERIEERSGTNWPADGRAIVAATNYVLDKLTAPEGKAA